MDRQQEERVAVYPQMLQPALRYAIEKLGGMDEIHLRCGCASEVVRGERSAVLKSGMQLLCITEEILSCTLQRIAAGSVYQWQSQLAAGGFSPGKGVRVGVNGIPIYENNAIRSYARFTSLCIRYPAVQQLPDVSQAVRLLHMDTPLYGTVSAEKTERKCLRSILFFGEPGSGKTTLLRALLLALSGEKGGMRICVMDFTGELYASFVHNACRIDFFVGYRRLDGIVRAQRFFAPQVIVCDEIGDTEDAEALIRTQHGGVALLATAHGDTVQTLLRRPGLHALWKSGVFDAYVKVHRAANGTFTFMPEQAVGA